MFVIVPVLLPSEAHTVFDRSSPWWAYPLFLQNFLVPSSTNATGPLAVTWSLAIEEQFYLLWPWVVRYCSSVQVRRIAIAVLCASPLLRLLLSFNQVDLYPNVFCRLDGLMAGALLALLARSDSFVPARYVRRAWSVLFDGPGFGCARVSLAVCGASRVAESPDEPFHGVYRNDQLWALLAAQDPVRYGAGVAARSLSPLGRANASRRVLRHGCGIVASPRAAILEVETAFRIAGGRSRSSAKSHGS